MKTVTITESSRGNKLQKPLTLTLPEAETAADKKLQQYIIDALLTRMPSLVTLTFQNTTTIELAKHLLRHRTGSPATLYQYIYGVHRFSLWTNTQPDQLVKACQDQDGDPKPKALSQTSRMLDDFVANLQAENLAPGTVSNHVKGVKALFRCNGLKLELPYSLSKRSVYEDRAPTPEELQKMLDISRPTRTSNNNALSIRRISHRHTIQAPVPPRQTRPRKRHNPNPRPCRIRNNQRQIPRLRHIPRTRSSRIPQSLLGHTQTRQPNRQKTPRNHKRQLTPNSRRTKQPRQTNNHRQNPLSCPQPLRQSRTSNQQPQRKTLRPTSTQHTQILPHTTGIAKHSNRLHRIHDGTHNQHLPRHTHERHRIPPRRLHFLRTKHKTENTTKQTRSPQRNDSRMGTQP